MSDDFSLLRERKIGKRRKSDIAPDAVYGNLYVSKLINKLMKGGNKSVVYNRVVLPALALIKERHEEDPCQVLANAITQVRPSVELSRASPKSHYQVPVEIKPDRALSMAIRFIADAARKQAKTEQMYKVLCRVIHDSANNRGAAIEKKNNLHSAAAANTAFKAF